MNNLIKIICIVSAILLLYGCGNNAENKKSTTTNVTTAETTTVPATVETTTEKIGELAGKKIVVDAGHGCTVDYTEPVAPGLEPTNYEGPGTGTSGVSTGIPEKTLTLQIALALEKELKAKGAEVVMIRSTEGTKLSLQGRAETGNESGADFSIRIHADGLDDQSARGATLLYPSPEYVGNNISAESKVIAKYISDNYCKVTGIYNRGLSERGDLTGFNFSTIPVVLIELGFMSNPEEDNKMSQPDFQKKMVQGIMTGITEYYNNK